MSSHRPVFSIVVPFNGEIGELRELVRSYELSKFRILESLVELIVVDNRDETVQAEHSITTEFQGVVIISCGKPGSYAARNLGVKASRGSVLIFTDSDCRLSESFFSELEKAHRENLFASKIVSGQVTIPYSATTSMWGKFDSLTGIPQHSYAKRGYGATALLITEKTTFVALGGFDENHYSGGDAEFCLQARRIGIPLSYQPRLEVIHRPRSNFAAHFNKIDRTTGAQISRWKDSNHRSIGRLAVIFFSGLRGYSACVSSQIPTKDKFLMVLVATIMSAAKVYCSLGHFAGLRTKKR